MQIASVSDSSQSWLAVERAVTGCCFLAQAGEIFSVPPFMPVPHAALVHGRGNLRWTAWRDRSGGISRVRGDAEIPREQARLIAINPALRSMVRCWLIGCGCIVRRSSRLLRSASSDGARIRWRLMARDSDGRNWQESTCRRCHDEHFLRMVDDPWTRLHPCPRRHQRVRTR
jgi:hypothetical protein